MKYYFLVNNMGDILGIKKSENKETYYSRGTLGEIIYPYEIDRNEYEFVSNFNLNREQMDLYFDYSEPRESHYIERIEMINKLIDSTIFEYCSDINGEFIINADYEEQASFKFESFKVCFKGTLADIEKWSGFKNNIESITVID